MIAGGPVSGSWWGHPRGAAIFRAMNALGDRSDVVSVKLVSGKVTFVHRRFWPHLTAIGSSRAAWQMEGLSSSGHALLDLVRRRGSVRTDDPAVAAAVTPKRPGLVAADLEQRLLVQGMQVHTKSGAHAKVLSNWRHWARGRTIALTDVPAAQAALDEALLKLNGRFHGDGRLPWWR